MKCEVLWRAAGIVILTATSSMVHAQVLPKGWCELGIAAGQGRTLEYLVHAAEVDEMPSWPQRRADDSEVRKQELQSFFKTAFKAVESERNLANVCNASTPVASRLRAIRKFRDSVNAVPSYESLLMAASLSYLASGIVLEAAFSSPSCLTTTQDELKELRMFWQPESTFIPHLQAAFSGVLKFQPEVAYAGPAGAGARAEIWNELRAYLKNEGKTPYDEQRELGLLFGNTIALRRQLWPYAMWRQQSADVMVALYVPLTVLYIEQCRASNLAVEPNLNQIDMVFASVPKKLAELKSGQLRYTPAAIGEVQNIIRALTLGKLRQFLWVNPEI